MAESSSDEEELNKVSEQIQIRQQQQQQEDLQQSIYQPPPSAVQHALPLPAAPMVDGSHVLTGEENVPMKSKARKRKLPLPEMFLESGEPLPLPGKKYKENTHFPWLEIVGPTCHSDKQVHSGRDLSAAKKKYRRMRCLDCAAYNAATPWAALWPRKFELQTLVDHSQSSHHMKSEAARKKLGIASGAALPAEDAISALAAASSVSSSSTAAAAGASTAGILGTGIGDPAMANIAAGAGGGHSGSVSAVLALPLVNSADAAAKSASMIATVDVPAAMASETTTMTSAAAAEGGAMLSSSSSSSGATALAATLEGEAPPALKTASVPANNNSSIGIPTQPAGGETTVPVAPPANAASRSGSGGGGKLYGTKGAARPDWLYFEGQLCFSDKQAAAAELPAGTKKKYRRVQCLYCLEYLPESPWSQLKPRKFESAVLADHERSGYHQKALELRATHLGIALPLPPLPPQPPSSSGGGGTGSTEAAVKEEALSVVAGAGIPVPVTAAAAAAAAAAVALAVPGGE